MGKENVRKIASADKRVIGIKGTAYICIPKKFLLHYGLQIGDLVALVPCGGSISVMPRREK